MAIIEDQESFFLVLHAGCWVVVVVQVVQVVVVQVHVPVGAVTTTNNCPVIHIIVVLPRARNLVLPSLNLVPVGDLPMCLLKAPAS